MAQNNSIANLLVGAATGLFLGFAAGVLLAPSSGKETRRKLRKQADQAKKQLQEFSEDIKDSLEGSYTQVVGEIKKLTERTEKAVENAAQKASDKIKEKV